MIFEYIEAGPLLTNCYILGDEKTKQGAVVDPGGDVDQILMVLARFELKCEMIIVTHAHPDHVGGNAELVRVTNAPIVAHKKEVPLLTNLSAFAAGLGMRAENSPSPSKLVDEGDILTVGSIKMKVLHIPGHSPGHICLVLEDKKRLIVGDVLFQMSIGRTDFPGGSHELLIQGIKEKLLPLGDDFEVYPGHGPPTTIGYERKYNPFLNSDW